MADLISVPNSYLETLIRRAALHSPTEVVEENTIVVLKADYAELQRSHREYLTLRQALIRGGLTLETLEVLLHSDSDQSGGYEHVEAWNTSSSAHDGTETTGTNGKHFQRDRPKQAAIATTRIESESSPGFSLPTDGNRLETKPGFSRKSSGPFMTTPYGEHELYDGPMTVSVPRSTPPTTTQRTILISNLHNKVTHLDLTKIIKGGRLLDIHLRNDRTAAVSFVEGATDFLAYAKRQDLYLLGKRLEFRWSERQYYVPNHIANKLANGATRNLVIRIRRAKKGMKQPDPLSEQGIRDDLEHIHTMQIVSVTFKNGDCYISTNSVQNAIFARTCMISRAKYRGLRIEWYPDECSQPLPQSEKRQPSPPHRTGRHPAVAGQHTHALSENRFGVLDTTAADATSDTESEFHPVTKSLSWADEGVLV